MFNWNVEEMKLLDMPRIGEGYDKAFACESEVSIEDKFEFVDRMQGGNLSYIVGLHKDYQEAIPSMKKDAKGNPTNYAKRAWVRANDTQGLICRKTDSYNDYGDFNILGHCGNLFAFPNRKGEVSLRFKDDTAFINDLFHKQLEKCKDMEYNLFYSQDKTAQYLASFEDKLYDHRIHRGKLDEDFDIWVTLAAKPSERNKVVVTKFSAGYSEMQRKELSLEDVHQIDTTLVALDELKAKIEQAQQAYEEARLTVAEKIKSMATN